MKSRLRLAPPKQRLAQRSGSRMRPISSPVGIEDRHAVEPLAAAPAAPEVAVGVAAQAVGDARAAVDEDAPVGELRAVGGPRRRRGSRAAWRRSPPRRAAARRARSTGRWAAGRRRSPPWPRPSGRRRGTRWWAARRAPCGPRSCRGSPKGGSVNQIESSDFTTTSFGELSGLPSNRSSTHRDGAVVLGAGHAAAVVLAGDEPALAVARVAVGEVRRLAEHADRARLLVPAHDPVVGDVAPQQVAPVAEPHRAPPPSGSRWRGAPRRALKTRYLAKLSSRICTAGSG